TTVTVYAVGCCCAHAPLTPAIPTPHSNTTNAAFAIVPSVAANRSAAPEQNSNYINQPATSSQLCAVQPTQSPVILSLTQNLRAQPQAGCPIHRVLSDEWASS